MGAWVRAVSVWVVLFWALSATSLTRAAEGPLEQGAIAFQRGALEEAANRWAAAAQASAQPGHATERISALIHLARAQSELGQYRQATVSLRTALQLAESIHDRERTGYVSAALGNVYIALGPPETAEHYLRAALAIGRDLPGSALAAVSLNDLGNLLVTQQKYDEAVSAYRESIALAVDPRQQLLRARSQLNAAIALREHGKGAEALTLLDQALAHLRVQPLSREVAFSLISVGLGYRELRTTLTADRDRLTLQASNVLTYAARAADSIGDRRTASYAWGYLAGLYAEEKRSSEALDLTRRAIFAAQQVNAPESLYRWQWQAGRLLREADRTDEAIDAYQRAVETLQGIRPELAVGYGTPAAAFRDSTGRVYFELVDLLLQRARSMHKSSDLIAARETVERFKAAELRDYFRDDCVDAALSQVTHLEVVAKTAVVVYPILLSDRMELLVSLPSGLKSVVVPVGLDAIKAQVRELRSKLENRASHEYLPHAQQLYAWLVAPLEADLAGAHIDTLVFVPDGPLRTIPMSALHDGTQFLISRYAVAITPGLDLTDPRPIRREQAKMLAVGVTEAVQGFAPLPNVAVELNALRGLYQGTTLMDRQFVVSNLETQLKGQQFTIVHIASHGEFSGDASQTFLLSFDQKLTMDRLDRFISLFKYRDNPLELLTLSACDTAEGDDRAALGLAGVAVRAGARSAMATLWTIHDKVTAELVTQFYRELQNPSTSRAVALQRAQLRILSDPRYRHPAYWSPFLMINSWL